MKTLPMKEAQVYCLRGQWIRCRTRNVSLKCYSTKCWRAKAQEVAIEQCKNSNNKAMWSKISVLYLETCTLSSWHCQAGKAEIVNGHCSNQISTWLGTTTAFCTNIPRKIMTWSSEKKSYVLFLVLCLHHLLTIHCVYKMSVLFIFACFANSTSQFVLQKAGVIKICVILHMHLQFISSTILFAHCVSTPSVCNCEDFAIFYSKYRWPFQRNCSSIKMVNVFLRDIPVCKIPKHSKKFQNKNSNTLIQRKFTRNLFFFFLQYTCFSVLTICQD